MLNGRNNNIALGSTSASVLETWLSNIDYNFAHVGNGTMTKKHLAELLAAVHDNNLSVFACIIDAYDLGTDVLLLLRKTAYKCGAGLVASWLKMHMNTIAGVESLSQLYAKGTNATATQDKQFYDAVEQAIDEIFKRNAPALIETKVPAEPLIVIDSLTGYDDDPALLKTAGGGINTMPQGGFRPATQDISLDLQNECEDLNTLLQGDAVMDFNELLEILVKGGSQDISLDLQNDVVKSVIDYPLEQLSIAIYARLTWMPADDVVNVINTMPIELLEKCPRIVAALLLHDSPDVQRLGQKYDSLTTDVKWNYVLYDAIFEWGSSARKVDILVGLHGRVYAREWAKYNTAKLLCTTDIDTQNVLVSSDLVTACALVRWLLDNNGTRSRICCLLHEMSDTEHYMLHKHATEIGRHKVAKDILNSMAIPAVYY